MITLLHLSLLVLVFCNSDTGVSGLTENTEACSTQACYSTGKRILSNMDLSVNPCEDFYSFTCGNFLKETVTLKDEMRVSHFTLLSKELESKMKSILFQKSEEGEPQPYVNLKHFLSLCMDEKRIDSRGIAPALERLEKAGGWPVLGNWSDESWNVLDVEIHLRQQTNSIGKLFLVVVNTDMKETSKRTIKILEAETGINFEIIKKGLEDDRVKAYYDYMVDLAVMFGADRDTAKEEMKESLLFEIEIAKLRRPAEENRDFENIYNTFTLERLSREVPWMDWRRLLNGFLPQSLLPLPDDEIIIVDNPQYLHGLGNLLKLYPKKTTANYMVGSSVRDLALLLGNDILNKRQQLVKFMIGTSKRYPRWKECFHHANEMFNLAMSSLYVRNFFDKTSMRKATKMAENIKNQMTLLLEYTDWMSDDTRRHALEKLEKMSLNVGYPDQLADISEVEEYYKGLVLNEDEFLEAKLKAGDWNYKRQLLELRQPVDRMDWRFSSNVIIVNAFYSLEENAVKIPAGILGGAFFNKDLPEYLNLASIGFAIGHEITHGFDDQGSQMDGDGNMRNWWDSESKRRFQQKSHCIVNQYNHFIDPQTHLNINGVITQGENIADNGGMHLIYEALQRLEPEPLLPGFQNYTREQMFLIGLGNLWCAKSSDEYSKMRVNTNVHPPSSVRVNGAMINFPYFQDIFHCSPSDPMVKPKKCPVW